MEHPQAKSVSAQSTAPTARRCGPVTVISVSPDRQEYSNKLQGGMSVPSVADLSVKKFRAAALRERESAIASNGPRMPLGFPGLAVSAESEIGGFFGGSTTVCGRCHLRTAAFFFFGVLAASLGFSPGRRLWRVSGQHFAFAREVHGIEPSGNTNFQSEAAANDWPPHRRPCPPWRLRAGRAAFRPQWSS
jgi:hypothetical protein